MTDLDYIRADIQRALGGYEREDDLIDSLVNRIQREKERAYAEGCSYTMESVNEYIKSTGQNVIPKFSLRPKNPYSD